MKRVLAVSCFCLALALFLVSCASKPEELIVGKWQEISGKETIEFLKDKTFHGRLMWDLTREPVDVDGTYSVKGDLVTLVLTRPSGHSPMTLKVDFLKSGKEMTVTYQQGGPIKLDGSVLKYQKQG